MGLWGGTAATPVDYRVKGVGEWERPSAKTTGRLLPGTAAA